MVQSQLSRRQEAVHQTTPDSLAQCQGFSYRHTGGTGPYDFEVVEAETDQVIIRWNPEPVAGNIDWWADVPGGTTIYFNVLQGGTVAYTSPRRTVQPSNDVSCFFTQPDILTDAWHEFYGDTVEALLAGRSPPAPGPTSSRPSSNSAADRSTTVRATPFPSVQTVEREVTTVLTVVNRLNGTDVSSVQTRLSTTTA
jgi:hypothetical protein